MQAVVQELTNLIAEYASFFQSLSEEVLAFKPQPNKWSKKEIIGHLIDSAQNNIRRFVCGQYEPQPKIVYDQDFWVKSQHYQDYSSQDLIQLWVLLNRHICLILSNLPQKNLEKTCDTGKGKVELHTLRYLAEDYVVHLKHHLAQMK
ncbi:MAG: DinB family protein [Microscillaceae bacterium]|jgi:hypothetical protein|nr:DinB family protein [Microscillaceae bacterium]